MRLLVDTSVWSLSLRRNKPSDHPKVALLETHLQGETEIVMAGIVLQEVLQAFRDDGTFDRVEKNFEAFPILPLVRRELVMAASLHRACAARGVAASTVDCQIAAQAIQHDCHLLTADRDFDRIAGLAPLRLLA